MAGHSFLPKILGLIFACTMAVQAQLNVDLQLNRRQFIQHEAISVAVRLTNRAGRELDLYGDGRRPWLNFVVTNEKGVAISPYGGRLNFQRAKVPVGRSVARQVNLNSLFPLGGYGRYTVYAVVNLPTGESFQSNRASFNLTKGRTIYEQRVGMGKKSRDYRLITFAPERVSYLYFQSEIVDDRRVVQTYPLGEMLTFRKPEATVDHKGRLNVLYLASPDLYQHILIDDRGRVSKRTLYKRGAVGDPRLVAFKNGEVKVAGGIEHDPKKRQEDRQKIRKISERPSVLFD